LMRKNNLAGKDQQSADVLIESISWDFEA
jgi:hypothetical protein